MAKQTEETTPSGISPEEVEVRIKQARKADLDLIAFIEKERDENIQKLADQVKVLKSERASLEDELGQKKREISDLHVRIFELGNEIKELASKEEV